MGSAAFPIICSTENGTFLWISGLIEDKKKKIWKQRRVPLLCTWFPTPCSDPQVPVMAGRNKALFSVFPKTVTEWKMQRTERRNVLFTATIDSASHFDLFISIVHVHFVLRLNCRMFLFFFYAFIFMQVAFMVTEKKIQNCNSTSKKNVLLFMCSKLPIWLNELCFEKETGMFYKRILPNALIYGFICVLGVEWLVFFRCFPSYNKIWLVTSLPIQPFSTN